MIPKSGNRFSVEIMRKLVTKSIPMKVRNSLKSLRGRHRDNKIVRRKGRVYIINKTNARYKARQG